MTPTPLQIDTHLNYLISLIPDDNVIYTYSHEIHYSFTNNIPIPELVVHVRAQFQTPMEAPYRIYRIDPENTTGSINQLLKLRAVHAEPHIS